MTAIFQEALALHQRGQLRQAAELYKQILSAHPTHSDSLHLLGVASFQSGDYASAVDLISRSIEIAPMIHFIASASRSGVASGRRAHAEPD